VDEIAASRFEFANYIHPHSVKTLEHLKLNFRAIGACDPYFGAHDEVVKLVSAGCSLKTLDLNIDLLDEHEYFMNPQVWNKITIFSNFLTLRNISLEIFICEVFPTEADILAKRLSEILRATFSMFANEPRVELTLAVHGSLYTDPVVVVL
jgi:hypothetical protein